jgi:hypothetical protein
VNERGRCLVTVVDYTNAESIHKERPENCPPDAQRDASEATMHWVPDRGGMTCI